VGEISLTKQHYEQHNEVTGACVVIPSFLGVELHPWFCVAGLVKAVQTEAYAVSVITTLATQYQTDKPQIRSPRSCELKPIALR